MNDAEIKQRLRDRNLWWRDPEWWRADRVLRDAANASISYAPAVLESVAPPNLYTLVGPRRVGKSVCLRRKIKDVIDTGQAEARSVIYCSCDDFRAQDLRRMFKTGRALTPGDDDATRWWFIDEITAVPDWAKVVKDLRDDTAVGSDCVVLTGSSSRDLREAIERLAGRRGPDSAESDRLLMPMGFRDFCAVTGIPAPALEPVRLTDLFSSSTRDAFAELSFWTEDLVDAWENYLRVGGFPRAVSDYIDTGDVSAGFARDLWDVIRGDAIRRGNLTDGTILAFLERLGKGLASPLNASDVARDIGLLDNHVTNDRVDDLAVNFLAWRCPQDLNGAPNPTAQKKVYFTDPLLARVAAIIDGRSEPEVSKLSEQQIGLCLARAIEGLHPGAFTRSSRLLYRRTKTKKEIDFVGPDLDGCVEGKYADRGWKAEALTAKANYERGILATRRDFELDDGPFWAVPAPFVAWLLGI